MGISLFLGGSKRLPRWFGALTVFGSIQPCRMVKNGPKKSAPECPVECGGRGGPIAIWAMPKCRGRQTKRVFPIRSVPEPHLSTMRIRSIPTLRQPVRCTTGEGWRKNSQYESLQINWTELTRCLLECMRRISLYKQAGAKKVWNSLTLRYVFQCTVQVKVFPRSDEYFMYFFNVEHD